MAKQSYQCSTLSAALEVMQSVKAIKMVDAGKKYEFFAQLISGDWVFLKGSARPYRYCHIYCSKVNGNIDSDRIGAYVRTLNSNDPGKDYVRLNGFHKTLEIASDAR